MKTLSYQTLQELSYDGYLLKDAPERILQFGEGNFLRAFVDDFIDRMNEHANFQSKVVVCQPGSPNPAGADRINAQEGLYTLLLRGQEDGAPVQKKRIISCISRCLNLYRDFDEFLACAKNPDLRFITCNTTEAGIVYDPACQLADRPAASYPGKLTQFLYRRFQELGSTPGKGFIILACELIDDNGLELERCILRYAEQWKLGSAFTDWLKQENLFCSTLVDRIVTGYPRSEADSLCDSFGYRDNLIDTGEPFAIWVIEGPQWLKQELPFEQAGLPVLLCNDHHPYKQRKVRILNGAHTSMVPGAYLAGLDIVRDCMHDPTVSRFLDKTIYDEILPTLTLPRQELLDFAASVKERFANPFIDHALLSICLNCTSKWRARVLPSLKAYVQQNSALPPCLTASFAFYLAFYYGGKLTPDGLLCERPAGAKASAPDTPSTYLIKDDQAVLDFFDAHSADDAAVLVHCICTTTAFWDEDLTTIPGFEKEVTRLLTFLLPNGTRAAMEMLL